MGRMMGPANQQAAKFAKEVVIPYNVRFWKPKGSLMNPSDNIDLVLVDWINYAIEQGWISTSGGSGTDLAYTASATNGIVTSDTGTDATIPLATGSNAGLLPPVPALTALTAGGVDQAADYMFVWDASASAYKKILANFVTPATALVSESVSITSGNAGASLRITATATGTTCSFASNTFTITIPAGETLISAHLVVTTADIQQSADGGGFDKWVKIVFVNTPDNNGLSTIRVPISQKCALPDAGAISVSNGAQIDADGNPPFMCVGVSSNSVSMRISGLVSGGQGYLLSFTGF